MNTPTNDEPQPHDRDMAIGFLDEIGERLSVLDNDILFAVKYIWLLHTIRDFVIHEIDRFEEDAP